MSIVTYQYKRLKDLKVPIITLAIRYGEMWHPVEAYVDTGATYSVFTAQVADRLGLSYRTGRKVYVQVGDGGFIPVYLHDLEIQIGKHRVVVPLGFSGKLGISFNLLGRTGIFDFFKVCFDERDFVVTFTQYELQP
jgi:predicted aspartyl protease